MFCCYKLDLGLRHGTWRHKRKLVKVKSMCSGNTLLKDRIKHTRILPYSRECVSTGVEGCMNPQIFGTSAFAPADFEVSNTMCTRCFETQSSPGCTCTRRSKFLTHSLPLTTPLKTFLLMQTVSNFTKKTLKESNCTMVCF